MATVAEKIIASLPKNLFGPKAQAALRLIIAALSGERIHVYDSWHVSGGWKTLRSADGADDAFRALKAAGVPVVTGNDAPRGLYRGEKVHVYSGSHYNGRRRELHNTAGVSQAELIIEKTGIKILRGNDAPRGGELGKYISLPRRNLRIAAQITELYDELYASVRANSKWGTKND